MIYNADCLSVFGKLQTASVDAVVSDPPYFITDLKFDDKRNYTRWWAGELLRVVKPNGYLVSFGGVEVLADIAKDWNLRFTGVWVKTNPVLRTSCAKKPPSKMEMYAVFAHPAHQIRNLVWNRIKIEGEPYRKVQRRSGFKRGASDCLDRVSSSGWTKDGFVLNNDGSRFQTDVLKGPNKPSMLHKERSAHPTQKPIAVMETLIQWVTNEGDIVFDPFMGSGSTGIACQRLGRQFIGVEKDETYFKIAEARLLNSDLGNRCVGKPNRELESVIVTTSRQFQMF